MGRKLYEILNLALVGIKFKDTKTNQVYGVETEKEALYGYQPVGRDITTIEPEEMELKQFTLKEFLNLEEIKD